MSEKEQDTAQTADQIQKVRLIAEIVIVGAALLVILGYILHNILNRPPFKTVYTDPEAQQIAEIESHMDIDIPDSVTVVRYKCEIASDGSIYELWLENIADYQKFLTEAVGTYELVSEDGTATGAEAYNGQEQAFTAQYLYYPDVTEKKYTTRDFRISFFDDDNGYIAKIYGNVY